MFSKFASQLKGAAALTCVAGLLSMSSSAFAGPFSISQAPQDQGSAWGSSVSLGLQNAESFTMSAAGTLQQIDWWGIEDDPINGDCAVFLVPKPGEIVEHGFAPLADRSLMLSHTWLTLLQKIRPNLNLIRRRTRE